MEVVRELGAERPRHIRHTLVKGGDGKFYKVLTFRLYDMDPPDEFHNFEVNVMLCDEHGRFSELFVPYYRRTYSQEEAVRHHAELLQTFDETLALQAQAGH